MKNTHRILCTCLCVIVLTSCATTITGSTQSTVASPSTSIAISTPTGSIIELLQQLVPVADGLGQSIIDSDSQIIKAKLAEAEAILVVLEPMIRESNIDVLESVQRVVRLIHSAGERKRPADADKALRFIPLIIEAITPLLNK